jgi:predicted flap endonuclease-1-like 5' DNA nuclease
MGFLVAKILLLLALTAACSALLTWWWLRRRYEDVTLDYMRSRAEWAAWRRDFEARLAERPTVDLAPLQARLEDIARRIADIRIPVAGLAPVEKRLMAIEHALFPVQTRLDELESAVRATRAPPAQPPTHLNDSPVPAPRVAVREGSRNLLSHAGHGDPDDLKRIKGVARVLERTLHQAGVFYFWQIAEWSPEDVKYVDSRLTAFKGRIERDDWVHQAAELAAGPTAARRPEELEPTGEPGAGEIGAAAAPRPDESAPAAAPRPLGH